MKKSLTKHLSLVLLICMLFSILGTACKGNDPEIPESEINGLDDRDTSGDVDTGGIMGTYQPPAGEYVEDIPEGYNQVTFYWVNPMYTSWKDYETCDIWIWYDDVDGKGYLMYLRQEVCLCVSVSGGESENAP